MPTRLFLTIVLLMPVIAIGINTAQFAPKYDREPWNARSWTLRDTRYGFAGGVANASTISVVCNAPTSQRIYWVEALFTFTSWEPVPSDST